MMNIYNESMILTTVTIRRLRKENNFVIDKVYR